MKPPLPLSLARCTAIRAAAIPNCSVTPQLPCSRGYCCQTTALPPFVCSPNPATSHTFPHIAFRYAMRAVCVLCFHVDSVQSSPPHSASFFSQTLSYMTCAAALPAWPARHAADCVGLPFPPIHRLHRACRLPTRVSMPRVSLHPPSPGRAATPTDSLPTTGWCVLHGVRDSIVVLKP